MSRPSKTFNVFALDRLRGDSETGSVFPISLANPLLFLFVVAIKRIVDQFVGKQIGVNAAWYGRVVPVRFPDLAELPALIDLR